MVIPRESPVDLAQAQRYHPGRQLTSPSRQEPHHEGAAQKRTPARKVNLESILACPACGGEVKMLRDAVKCTRCNSVYPIEHGFPMMLLDQDMRNRPPDEATSGSESREESPRTVGLNNLLRGANQQPRRVILNE